MISLRVLDVRKCMNKLLLTDTFDSFLLQEAIVNTYASFSVDGHRLDDFYTSEELEEMDDDKLVSYEMFREHLYSIIKGKKVPLSFKIILTLPKRLIDKIIEAGELSLHADAVNMVAIFRYTCGELTITSGTSFTEFIMDKSVEKLFDKWLYDYLNAAEIDTDKII